MAEVFANKVLLEITKSFDFWMKPFCLDVKPFETVFKTSKASRFMFIAIFLLLTIYIVSILSTISLQSQELSIPKIAELVVFLSKS